MTLDWINDHILRWACLASLVLYGYSLVFNKGIPNIRTAPAIRKRIIGLLKDEVRNHKGDTPFTIVDMGSGNGLFTREIAKAIPEARVIGLEISKTALAWARWLKKRKGLTNLDYIDQDFFSYPLSGADAVVMYLTIYQMEKMGEKLHAELKEGAFVSSNRFRLGHGWEPEQSVEVRTFYPHQKTFHVYHQKKK